MNEVLSDPVVIRLIFTIVLLAALAAARYIAGRWITRHTPIMQERQRRQFFYLRTAISVILAVGLIIVWGGHLQNLVLSLTAVMLAVVIATKELIMCLSGFMLRMTGRLFAVGDWIECNDLHGEVIDHTLLSTTILEVGSPEQGYGYTGRTLVLPNSVLLSHPVRTSPFARHFVFHRFLITLEAPVHPPGALERLQAASESACAPFHDEAQRVNTNMDHKLGVDIAGPEPFVAMGTSDIGKPQFSVTLFAPTAQAARLEREITAAFLAAVHGGELAGPAAGESAPST